MCALFYAMLVTGEPPCILDSVILAAGHKVYPDTSSFMLPG
jgi:hypothetical protein